MGFSLKGLVKGVAADVNPFDNGKSQGNLQGKPQPASTAQPQPSIWGRINHFADNVFNPTSQAIYNAPRTVVANPLKAAWQGGQALGYTVGGDKQHAEQAWQNAQQDYHSSLPGGIADTATKLAANVGMPVISYQNERNAKILNRELQKRGLDKNTADNLSNAYLGQQQDNLLKLSGHTINESPTVGGLKAVANFGQNALNAATLGNASELASGTAPNVLKDIVKSGNYMGASNVLGQAEQGNFSPVAAVKSYGTGFGSGALLGGVSAIPGIVGNAVKGAPEKVPAVNLNTGPEAYNMTDYADHIMGRSTLNNADLNRTIRDAQAVAKQAGIDITSGSPRERDLRIADYMNARDNAIAAAENPPAVQPTTGLVSKVKDKLTPLNDVGAIGRDVRPQSGPLPIVGPDLNPGPSTALVEQSKHIENKPQSETQGSPVEPSLQSDRQPSASSSPETSTKDYINQLDKAQKDASKSSGSKLSALKQDFAVKGLDALSPIEKPVERALGGRDKNVTLRNALDRSLRSDTIAGQHIKDSGLADVIKSVNPKEFNQYLTAKHAADVAANGIKTGRNLAQDAQLVQDLAPKYEGHAQQIKKFTNDLLDKTVDYGLISKETASYLKEKYPNYVPLDRVFTDEELKGAKGNGSGPASLSTQTVIQRLKGSERQIQPPLESLLAKTHDVFAQGERNVAAKTIADTAKLPSNPLQLKELKPGQALGNRPSISYIENGQKRTFLTTPEVAQAAKSLNKQQLGLVGKILSYPTRALRLGATGVNVGFTLANVTKDVASGFINSEHPGQSLANPKVFLDALSSAVHHNGKSYSELVREGAGGTSFDIARNSAKDTVAKIHAGRNPGTKVLYTVRHPGELLRAVEDTIGRSEEFGRASQYFGNKEAALKQGKSLSEAKAYGADAARNNTVNFARAGEYGRVLNSVLPYFNAGIQGSRTLLRNVRDRPVQTGAKIAISAFLPVAATTAWALSDPKRKEAYDDLQDYEKQGNIIIVPPNPKKDPKTGRWNVIKIPVSQEIANLNNEVRNGVEALHKDKGFNFGELAGNLTGTATSLNVQSPRQAVGQVVPQAVKPGIEALTNQNLFTGNPIVPDSKKNLDAADQYGKTTSGTARTLGKVTGVSPFQIDNFIKTTFGGAGQNAVNLSDRALAKAGAISPDDVRGQSFGHSISNRFTSAQGQSEYAPIDKALKEKTDALKKLPGYKSMSPDDKAKAIQRLQSDVVASTKRQVDAKNSTGPYAPGNTDKVKNLSTRQAGLLNGTTDIASYLAPVTTSGAKTKSPQQTNYDNKVSDSSLTLDRAKRTGDVKTWLSTAQDQYNTIDAYKKMLDPTKDHVKINSLTNKQEELKATAQKYTSYGGFAKPKTGRSTKSGKAKSFTPPKATSGTVNTTALRNLVKGIKITRRKKVSAA